MLRDAIRQWVAGDTAGDATLGAALRTAAREARDRGIRAEELLVTLKATWFELGGGMTPAHSSVPDHRKLDDLVTACIKAYYE